MSSENRIAARARQIAHVLNADLGEDVRQEIESEYLRVQTAHAAQGRTERRVLLIGGAGYVGSVITGHLLDSGYRVRCLDLLLYRNDVCALPYLRDSRYEFVHGDHCDPSTLQAAMEGVTDVAILSGLVGDPITKKYPDESHAINDDGMRTVLDSLNGRGLNRVIFVSTCSNYGLIPEDALADETYALQPMSLYAESKVAVEKRLLSDQDVDYVPTVLRFSTAFGLSARMRFDLTVNEFARAMYLRQDLLVYDGHTWRPYCHTTDFARAIRRVLEIGTDRVRREVFNVGCAENNCTKQMIVDKILKHLPESPVRYKEHGTDPRNYRVDFRKIREQLQFEPVFTVDDGVAEILQALENRLFDRVDENRPFYGNYEIEYAK